MTLLYRVFGAHVLLFLALGTAIAEPNLVLNNSTGFFQNRGILTATGRTQPIFNIQAQSASLMPTQANLGFFAPLPPRPQPVASAVVARLPASTTKPTKAMTVAMRAPYSRPHIGADVEQIRYIIGQAESRRHGYDAVQHGAKIRPSKPPTQMTIQEIYAWIDATPKQPHAIGRYQFIPKTLRRVVAQLNVPHSTQFTPTIQDALADILLEEAGLSAFQTGQMKRHDFMNNLAKIWAGLPNSTGKSHYHGFAGNKASITWNVFDAQMQKIRFQ
jgi:muramidase (phage lysozyme)